MAVGDVSYAEGWDAGARVEFGLLTPEEATARDRDGEPYVVVLREAGRAVPTEVHLVAWRDSYVGQWVYDEWGRRTREVDLRLLEPDRLFLRQYVERRYASPEQPDRAPDAWRMTLDLYPGGKGGKILEERGEGGGSYHTVADVPEGRRWYPRSRFGVRAHRARGAVPAPAGVPTANGMAGEMPAAREDVWRPPRPGRPGLDLDALFRPGERFVSDHIGELTVDRVRHIATLRVPSGRLVVADGMEPDDPRELTERIPPGEYPLETTVLVGEYEFMGERVAAVEEPVVRLVVRDEPVVSWEMGLSADDDPRLLLDGHAYGFGTDGATGCFSDAAAWPVLSERFLSYFRDQAEGVAECLSDGCVRVTDDDSGSDLVSFCTEGDGTWPVWLGRSADGEPAVVAVITAWSQDLRAV
ncbi:DUF4241 domain-containing protein [Streptomyces sp. NPDC004783]|uniref:DUF4241 domain-containing protein n=1 Tax=Streptomyces sp. NPDC004783 TaxID=3154459 RepID=UPI0033BEFFA8